MSDRTYRIVLVNYLNTLPMLEGIRMALGNRVELILAHPADCAGILFRSEADYGLVPAGVLLDRQDWRRVTSLGIGCDGPVDTVCLFGQSPITEWKEVLLDYQSRTSVLLTRYLLRAHWGLDIPVRVATPGYEDRISGATGGLIIGDRAIRSLAHFHYVYDLGEAWKAHTGLPFIFALWVARAEGDAAFEVDLQAAMTEGINLRPEIARARQADYPGFDLDRYYRERIRYHLDAAMLQGFETFRERVGQTGFLSKVQQPV
jgi:chorismate dehydratase